MSGLGGLGSTADADTCCASCAADSESSIFRRVKGAYSGAEMQLAVSWASVSGFLCTQILQAAYLHELKVGPAKGKPVFCRTLPAFCQKIFFSDGFRAVAQGIGDL